MLAYGPGEALRCQVMILHRTIVDQSTAKNILTSRAEHGTDNEQDC